MAKTQRWLCSYATFGQFVQGNQPALHSYLKENFINKPSLRDKPVRKIVTDLGYDLDQNWEIVAKVSFWSQPNNVLIITANNVLAAKAFERKSQPFHIFFFK